MKRFFLYVAMVFVSLTFSTVTKAQSLDENEDFRNFRKWVVASQEPRPMEVLYKWCIESYDKMIAGGVSPSTYVDDKDWGPFWKGTVKEIKEKYCDAGLKKLTVDLAEKFAPYKANLKADKLRLVIDEKSGTVYRYALAGGKYTDDAKALAAAKVWFLNIGTSSAETRYCLNGGKINSVRRYSFDVNHKLLGTTEKEYCGDPPASAYK